MASVPDCFSGYNYTRNGFARLPNVQNPLPLRQFLKSRTSFCTEQIPETGICVSMQHHLFNPFPNTPF